MDMHHGFIPSCDSTVVKHIAREPKIEAGNTKGGSITVPLTSCLTGLDQSVQQIKTKIFSSHTTDSKPVKQEVNGTVKLPPFSIPRLRVWIVLIDRKRQSKTFMEKSVLHMFIHFVITIRLISCNLRVNYENLNSFIDM